MTPTETKTVQVHRVYIKATPQAIWDAITKPEWTVKYGYAPVVDFELRKGGVSYTIDSVRHFRARFPGDDLFWIIGGDQLSQLHLWKDIRELVTLTDFIVLERPGLAIKAEIDVPGLRLHRCHGHLLEISSTELRERARQGLPLDYFMPHQTIAYLHKKNLYR